MPACGTCLHMCPPQEVEMRERERLLHPLEMLQGCGKLKIPKADPYKVVKCFSRSAAGVNLSSPDILRPASVLIKTIKYLLTVVLNDSRFDSLCKYNFIEDRMRAVQQDMVIQCLPSEDAIKILEPIVLFHCLYGYRLCLENVSQYDPVINKTRLLEYLKRLLLCYDALDSDNLVNSMEQIKLNETVSKVSNRRCLIEAIYIIYNLGDVHPLERYLGLPKIYKSGYIKTSYEISLCHLTRNWVRECVLMKLLPPLVLCAGVLHLPEIRRTAYHVMSKAYDSNVLKYPVENLAQILLYENNKDLIEECQYYNLQIVEKQYIVFKKDSFKFNKVFPLKKLKLLDDLIDDDELLG